MGGAAIYKLLPLFTYINGYWEVYRRFPGCFLFCFFWGGGELSWVTWEDLSMEDLSWVKRISMKRVHDFLAIFKKNNEKINTKKLFNSN